MLAIRIVMKIVVRIIECSVVSALNIAVLGRPQQTKTRTLRQPGAKKDEMESDWAKNNFHTDRFARRRRQAFHHFPHQEDQVRFDPKVAHRSTGQSTGDDGGTTGPVMCSLNCHGPSTQANIERRRPTSLAL